MKEDWYGHKLLKTFSLPQHWPISGFFVYVGFFSSVSCIFQAFDCHTCNGKWQTVRSACCWNLCPFANYILTRTKRRADFYDSLQENCDTVMNSSVLEIYRRLLEFILCVLVLLGQLKQKQRFIYLSLNFNCDITI